MPRISTRPMVKRAKKKSAAPPPACPVPRPRMRPKDRDLLTDCKNVMGDTAQMLRQILAGTMSPTAVNNMAERLEATHSLVLGALLEKSS